MSALRDTLERLLERHNLSEDEASATVGRVDGCDDRAGDGGRVARGAARQRGRRRRVARLRDEHAQLARRPFCRKVHRWSTWSARAATVRAVSICRPAPHCSSLRWAFASPSMAPAPSPAAAAAPMSFVRWACICRWMRVHAGRMSGGDRVHVLLRAALSSGDEGHHADPAGAGRAHRVQHAGSAARIRPSRRFI